jgi:glutathione S-transferase
VAAQRGLEGRDYLAENKLTLAELTLATAMQYIDFRYSHEWRSCAPRLAGWCCTLHDRSSFVSTQPPDFVRPA